MISFLEVYERAVRGPLMSEQDFDMKVFIPTLRDVVETYRIEYDPRNPVPSNDGAADNLFNAGLEFLTRVGIYCKDTNRVIQFTKAEILEAIKTAPGRCFLGEGKDAGVYGMRRPDDRKVPRLHVGRGWISSSEQMTSSIIEALASIPEANGIKFPVLTNIEGIPVRAGSPVEIYAAIRVINIGRDAIRRAGRPGMPVVNCIAAAATAVTTIAASAPQFGLRPTDGWSCATISEMKIDFGIMNKIAYLLSWGANIGAETAPVLGGYCGGAAGTAVVSTAYLMMGLLVHRGNFHLSFPIHFRYGCTTTRDILWTVSASCQAGSRNIPIPVEWVGYAAAGSNTRMHFYEAAAFLLSTVPSGSAGAGTTLPARGVKVDGATPLEAKFGVEIAKAACRLNRGQANELVIRLLEKYESQIPTAPEGDRYQDCYDVITGKPMEGYVRLYNEVKEELAGMGIPFE